MSVVGIEDKPIFLVDLPATAWALLWWLICRMDEDCEVHGGWRKEASVAMSKDRLWIQKCAQSLRTAGLIDSEPRERRVRVLIDRIQG